METTYSKRFFHYITPNIASAVVYFILLFPLLTFYISIEDFGQRALVTLALISFDILTFYGLVWILQSFFFEYDGDLERRSFLTTVFLYGIAIRITFFLLFFFFIHHYFYLLFDWSSELSYYFKLAIIARLLRSHEDIMIECWTMSKRSDLFFYYKLLSVLITLSSTIFFVVTRNQGLLGLFYADIILSTFSLLYLPFYAKTYLSFSPNLNYLKLIISVGYPAIPKAFFGTLNKNIIPYIISIFFPVGILGIYNRSTMLNSYFVFFSRSLRRTIVPDFTEAVKAGKDFGEVNIINTWFIFSILFISGISLFYEPFLILLNVSEDFLIIAYYTPLLLLPFAIEGGNLFNNSYLAIKKRTDLDTLILIFRFFITVITAYKLIPEYEILGGFLSLTISALSGYFLRHLVVLKLGSNGSLSFIFLIALLTSILSANYFSFILEISFIIKLFFFAFLIIFSLFLDSSFNHSYSRKIFLFFVTKKSSEIYKGTK